jgi:DNA-binding XRE family transcriptional regulator
MMENTEIFWDKKFGREEARQVLKDESNPRFIEFAALLLSRTNQPKVVFENYLDKAAFCNNWRRIKLRMRKDKWGDSRILFWDEVYRVVRRTIDKKELRTAFERNVTIDPDIRKLCEQIRETRKQQGMSQTDLAQKSGLSQQTISFVEQGYVNISIKTLKKIVDALRLKISLVPV